MTDSGVALTESLLILMWLEKTDPDPSLIDNLSLARQTGAVTR